MDIDGKKYLLRKYIYGICFIIIIVVIVRKGMKIWKYTLIFNGIKKILGKY